jgi:hypothetical protein
MASSASKHENGSGPRQKPDSEGHGAVPRSWTLSFTPGKRYFKVTGSDGVAGA